MHIIVWIILIVSIQALLGITFMAVTKGITYLTKERKLAAAHEQARKIKPQKGQVWIQDGMEDNEIYILDIGDDGSVVLSTDNPNYVKTNGHTWKDSAELWKERVANRKLVQGEQ